MVVSPQSMFNFYTDRYKNNNNNEEPQQKQFTKADMTYCQANNGVNLHLRYVMFSTAIY